MTGDAGRPARDERLVLLTGATGYVGGRLLGALERRGERLRCMARQPEHLTSRVAAGTEVVAGDCLDRASLEPVLRGVHTAYYLVHSMGAKRGFEEADRVAARNFATVARAAGVARIIYLGGLGDPRQGLSPHLQSRHETGNILRQSGVPVIELRASIVIGSGSLSFELIRALVERLPAMVTPRWVETQAQPIAIEDLLDYLMGALDLPEGQADRAADDTAHGLLAGGGVRGCGSPDAAIFEIGGADRVSYGDLMREYGRQRGLKRLMVPVPVLTPHLSSLWLGLVTPVYARIGRKLIDSLRNPSVVRRDSALQAFPIRPRGHREAIERALRNEDRAFAETRWSDAFSAGTERQGWGGMRFGNRIVDSRTIEVHVGRTSAFRPIARIGGKSGWYFADFLWRLRGFLDLLVGGVGSRRGRRDPERLLVGDVVDFWRVEAIEEGRRLRLVAEMELPGRAWLEFEVTGNEQAATIRQTAIFDPRGLSGLAYWYALYPTHLWVFRGMLRGIARRATRI